MKNQHALLLLLASVLGLPVAVAADTQVLEVKWPDTQAARLAKGWLDVCQTPTFERQKTWTVANASAEVVKQFDWIARNPVAMCAGNGGFRAVEIEKSDAKSITVLMVGRQSGLWQRMEFVVDDAGKLDRVGLWFAIPPEAALPKNLDDAMFAAEVKKFAAQEARLGLFSGIISVARGTQIIASASGGYANREKKTPITGSTQFTLGSMGKMFTAAAIGQLVDQHKLSFDDTVGKIFPDYPNKTVRDKVAVRMLLSHTAGMGDFLGKRTPAMMKNGVKTATEVLPLFDKDEPQFAPGTSWAYSNAGLVLAGAIVEKVSGEDYPDYLRKHIFAVAGMSNSDPNNIPRKRAQLVTPYTKMSEKGPTADWHEAEPDVGMPAGGAISTADDLIRFADALRNGKLVSPAVFAQMTQPYRAGGDYGLAMQIDGVYGRTVVGHGGNYAGVSTRLGLVLGTPYTVVVLANQDLLSDTIIALNVEAMTAKKAKTEASAKP